MTSTYVEVKRRRLTVEQLRAMTGVDELLLRRWMAGSIDPATEAAVRQAIGK